MEATIQSNNKAINIDVNVSVNVGALKANIQRVLSAVANSSLFTLHSSLIRLYHQELRMARAMARVIDEHPTISNICLWLMGLAFMVEVFLYA